jgi:hypothetical protein
MVGGNHATRWLVSAPLIADRRCLASVTGFRIEDSGATTALKSCEPSLRSVSASSSSQPASRLKRPTVS